MRERLFFEKVETLLSLIRQGVIPLNEEECRIRLNSFFDQGIHPIHHSSIFNETYHPHYRIVDQESLFEVQTMENRVFVKDHVFKGIEKNPSLLGFGCMRFPLLSPDRPDIDEVLAERMLDEAYARGVTYFDTAYIYHRGMSETFVGRVLKKYPRDSFYLATKMPGWLAQSVEDVKRLFQEQLQKCQVEYFDFYLCHSLGKENYPIYQVPGVMDFLWEMKSQGKIRHLGFSFHDAPEVLEDIIHDQPWDFVQIQLNYLDWKFQNARKQYQIIEKSGIPCIVMEPVRGGLLANLCEESRAIFQKAAPEASIASWAIRYAASKPNVMVVLSGMSTESQVQDNLKTMTDFHPITEADQRLIDKALRVFLGQTVIPCTACRYCMPCPHGLDIPHMFRVVNSYYLSKWKRPFVEEYEETPVEKRSENCVACGECMIHCPQKILIPDRMKEITTLYRQIKDELETKQ